MRFACVRFRRHTNDGGRGRHGERDRDARRGCVFGLYGAALCHSGEGDRVQAGHRRLFGQLRRGNAAHGQLRRAWQACRSVRRRRAVDVAENLFRAADELHTGFVFRGDRDACVRHRLRIGKLRSRRVCVCRMFVAAGTRSRHGGHVGGGVRFFGYGAVRF